jgi:lipopolysaccharide/colanic/teichoic acid biosynthesis glycosyltransferase
MNSSTAGSTFAGGLAASLLCAVAVCLLTSSTMLDHRTAYMFARHVTISSFIVAAVFAVFWQSCGILLRLPSTVREHRPSSFVKELKCSIATTVLLGLCMVLTVPRPPLVRVVVAFLGCAIALELLRFGIGMLLREPPRRVVIVGCDRLAGKAWREFRVHPERRMEVIGFVSQDKPTEMMPDIASRFLGDLEALPRIVLDQAIEDVVIATPVASHSQMIEESIASSGTLGARILCLKDICGIYPKSIARGYEDILFELVPAPRLDGFKQASKRVFDLTVSATFLLLGFALLLPVAVLSLLQWRPITYRPQMELGFRRRKYRRWRLHSAPDGPLIKLLVEMLPSMWSVFCGHMSLVGPPPVSETDLAQAEVAALSGRFNARPGVIGNHFGGFISAAFATNPMDNSNWSLRTDVKALARAFRMRMERSAAIETRAGAL